MNRNLNSRVLGDNDSFSEVTEDTIGSETPVDKIISALEQRGCLDLSSTIDWPACSNYPLAGGGFCDVFRSAMRDGTKIAIKSLRLYDRPGKDGDREKTRVLKRAARELYHWSKLDHSNVLPLMGLAVFRGQLSMISEWMENGNLTAFIKCNPDADRIGLCIDVCRGLCYIHASRMANVMVSSSNRAMIADFGNSQLRDITLNFSNTRSSGLSTRWAAPELLDDQGVQNLSKPADVYAFGMTMLEALTGKVPHDELTEPRVVTFVLFKRGTPARPAIHMNDEIWEILQDCWKWEQSERPEVGSVMKRLKRLFSRTSRSTITTFEGVGIDEERGVRSNEDHYDGNGGRVSKDYGSGESHHMGKGNDKDYDDYENPVRRAPTPEGMVPPPKRMRQAPNPDAPARYCEVHTAEQAKQTGEFKLPEMNPTHITPGAPGVTAALPSTHSDQITILRAPSIIDQPQRIYVGGITHEANGTNLKEFFNRKMTEMNASTRGDDDPVSYVQIYHDKNYAFVNFRSAELATEALVLNGIIFQSVPLKVRPYRPARRPSSSMGARS